MMIGCLFVAAERELWTNVRWLCPHTVCSLMSAHTKKPGRFF
ncbi:hypothetical protein CM49_02181 [Paenibacillus sp. P1XP2]|nr:hypothetical protein CM49_02181 [Paenibacillus sp. P1XP2]